jgi:hypothetical protein
MAALRVLAVDSPFDIEGGNTMTATDIGDITGTSDLVYDIISYTEACLQNALRLETYIADAERTGDTELVEFFRIAQADSRKGAELGKQMLASRLPA